MTHPALPRAWGLGRTRAAGAALLALMLAVLLTGCGPGTGGTGTGDSSPMANAQPQPLCASALAPALACPADVTISAAGSQRVAFASDAGNVVLVIEGNSARLLQGCPALDFEGRWSQLRDGSLQFVGEATTAATGVLRLEARLQTGLRTQAGQIVGLDIALFGADDQPLLPLRLLPPAAVVAPPPPCR